MISHELRHGLESRVALEDIIEPAAVWWAIAEFDVLCDDDLLRWNGFGHARRFHIEHDGNLYGSKALLGGRRPSSQTHGTLASRDFSRSESATVRKDRSGAF